MTAGRSQRLLAARIGVDHTTLSRWERGQDNIRLSTVDRIVGWVEREERRFAGRHVVSRTGPAVASSPRAAPSIPDVAAAAVTLEASILD